MTELRAGIIGCGMIGGAPVREGRTILGNHAQGIRDVKGLTLVAGAEPDAARREAFGRHWEISHLYPDAAQMLEREKLDIVVVATPPETHEAACALALARGVRGILCEKPFTGTAAGAQRIVEACDRAGCKLVVNFTRRWDSSHRLLAERIARGEIGDVVSVRGTYTGTLRGNGSHVVDTLRMLVPGEWRVEWASELARTLDDGPVEAVLTSGTARAFLVPPRAAEYFVLEIELLGTRGRARVTFHGNDIRIDTPQPHPRFPGYRFLSESAEGGAFPRDTMEHAGTEALRALALSVRDGSALPLSAREHIASLSLLDAIVNRAHSHGENPS